MYKTVKKYNLYIKRHKISFTCVNAVLAFDLEDRRFVVLLISRFKCKDASKTRFRFSILKYF